MDKKPKTMRLANDLAADYINALDARYNGEKNYIPSGFKTLDKRMPGWLHEGHLIIVAGRPAMGKSAFAQQVAEAVAAQQRTAILFTLEMSGYEITERALARRSGVPIPTLKTAASMVDDDWSKISNALAQFSPLPLLVDDASFDVTALVSKTKSAAVGLAQAGLPPLGCVVVDYLQLVGAKAANRTLEVGQVTSSLKRLAKELAVPVVALSQLNRAVESRSDKRPTLSDLRESGQIEQDADLVLFLYRDEYYDEHSPDKGIAEVIAAKNRHGTTGTTRLAFVSERVMFGDLAHE
ncbi:AAA family ATPase [Salmonella enterica]|nr:AAA family ATPase [Salmonella enterica]EEN6382833.1 AAA family ATPase [Salmonella enterica]